LHLNQLEPEEAKAQFSKALKIDPEDKLAKHGMTIAQNVDRFLTQNPSERLGQSFSTLLNTIGISLVRQGRMDEGIEHYKSAMAYVDDKDIKAKLAFNAALGNLRKKDFKTAKAWLDAAVGLNSNYPKAELYLNKIDQYLASDQRKAAFLPSSDAFDEIEGADQDENLDFSLVEEATPQAPAKKKAPAKKTLVLEQQKGQGLTPKDIRKNLISACPHAQEVFKMLSKQGVNTLSLMPEFNSLYETFGPQLLDKAFRRAVREFDAQPAKVKAILEELAAA
jgi:tetratricopeptide (TPR) repeat protein